MSGMTDTPDNVIDLNSRRPDQFSMVLGFDTDDEEFVRGFEAGMVWTQLKGAAEAEIDEVHIPIVHANNSEMLKKIAEVCHYTVEVEISPDPFWATATFQKK